MLSRFFKNAGIMAGTELVLRLKGFIFMPLLTRHFGPVNYGVWSQVITLVSICSPLLVLGTDSAAMRYFPGSTEEEKKRYFSAWNLFFLAVTVPFCLLILAVRVPLASFFFGPDREYILYVPLAAAALFQNIFLNTARNWYRIQNNAKVFSGISVAQAVSGIIALFLMIFLHKGPYELVLYGIIGDILIVAALFVNMARAGDWRKPDFTILPVLLKFGFPLVPIAYAMWGLNSMDRLFLVKYSTMEEVGIYSLVYYFGYLVIQVFVNPLWNMYPNSATELYTKNAHHDVQRLFDHVCGTIVVLTVPAVAGLLIMGRPIITMLATPAFLPGAPLMALVTASYLFQMIACFFETALGWIHRQYFVTISMICAFVINLSLNMVLIPRYTIVGAAWATCAAFLFHLLFMYVLVRRCRLMAVNLLFPLRICVLSGLMGIAVYGLAMLLPRDGLVPVLVLPCAGAALYGALIIAFGIVPPSFIRKARGRLFGASETNPA